MLSIVQIRGNGSYYTTVGRDDYYLSGGEPPGVWLGSGAVALGLVGKVNETAYRNLIDGFSPDGATPLVRNAGRENRRPGWDMTFSVPKSVSEWFASVSGENPEFDKQFREAILRAIKKTIARLEEVAAFGREGLGGTEHVRVKLIVAGFEHRTSRNYDPQIHWHCVVANAGITDEGETRAIVSKYLFRYKMAAGALFRAELARELRSGFGLELESKKSWFEIAGVPQSLIDAGSTRRKEILAELAKTGSNSAQAAKIAAIETRKAKVAIPADVLSRRWKQLAAEHGLGSEVARRLLNRMPPIKADISPELVSESVTRILETQSFFSERELVRSIAEKHQSIGADSADIFAKARLALRSLVRLGAHNREEQFTTQEMLDLEQKILARTFLGRLSTHHTLDKKRVLRIASSQSLSEEQTTALLRASNRPGNTQIIQGFAGTGKSTLFKAARIAFEEAGFNIIGGALSGKAAEGLELCSGIRSYTVASLLQQWRNERSLIPRLNAKSILVLDEASMLGTRQLYELIEHVSEVGAKLILVGDKKQLPAISAGAPFVSLSDRLGVATLTDIKRQVSEWGRNMVREFADGNVKAGVDALDEHGLVFVGKNREETTGRLLSDWSREENLKDVLILAGTHEDVSWINQEAQEIRKAGNFLLGSPVRVGKQDFFVGDRIIFRKNDRKIGVKNGTLGTIRAFKSGSFVVDLDSNEKCVFVPQCYDSMSLGYAMTTHKAQGVTVNRSYVLFSDALQSRELTYVQVSRARETTRLFLSQDQAGDLEFSRAVKAMERTCEKLDATEVIASLDKTAHRQRKANIAISM